MNPIHHKSIAIIGGGPGGLTLARLLQINGANVKVYERDVNRQVRVQGATLDLHDESGLKALRAAGLMDAFKANYRPGADQMKVLDKHAAIYLDEGFGTDDNHDFSRPEIDRGPLREILLDSLQPDTVVWDHQFLSLERTAVQPAGTIDTNATVAGRPVSTAGPSATASWLIHFANGQSATADIVIAADGANSRLRPYLTPIKPFYSGVTAIEGSVYDATKKVPELSQLTNGGKLFILSDAKTLIVSAKGDGSLSFYTGFKCEEHWTRDSNIDWNDKTQVLSWFTSEYKDWSPLWTGLFENAEPKFIPRPQYCMPFDQSWEAQPNLTMLGDAAHLMPPYAGEGVNMAMLDALELCECFLNHNNTLEAIAAYETQMLKRASSTAQMTMDQTEALHSPGSINHILEMIGIPPANTTA